MPLVTRDIDIAMHQKLNKNETNLKTMLFGMN